MQAGNPDLDDSLSLKAVLDHANTNLRDLFIYHVYLLGVIPNSLHAFLVLSYARRI